MTIVKQLDASDTEGVSDDLVGFVEVVNIGSAGVVIERYSGSVYRKALLGQASAIAHCPHEHREQHTAEDCLRQLLRNTSAAREQAFDQAAAGWVRGIVKPTRKR